MERAEVGRISQFAQELIDLIVDQLPDNEACLVVAFVSRSWLCSARRWLFDTVVLDGTDSKRSFKAFDKFLSTSHLSPLGGISQDIRWEIG